MREDPLREKITQAYREDENQAVERILREAALPENLLMLIQSSALTLAETLRKNVHPNSVEALLTQYDLSSKEGLALMSLAESLLRIPDNETRDKLIRDKLNQGGMEKFLKGLANWGVGSVVRQGVLLSIKLLGRHFVMGETIVSALKRAQKKEKAGYRYSYDMLGEAAQTEKDAERYYQAYFKAIEAIEAVKANEGKQDPSSSPLERPGISVKLSALYPRFVMSQSTLVFQKLYPRLKTLVLRAKSANINLTIDAEEAHTLDLTLDLIDAILQEKCLGQWTGFGLAIQAYQKRAPFVIDWLCDKLRETQQFMMIRLVKGAYWDTEIKLSQVQGLAYPVFTRKMATDVNYVLCAKKLFSASDVIYAQFATHNAYTVSTIIALAQHMNILAYEFQCLHGMGASLYDQLTHARRIYAPVGTQEDLLAYLVRRLLENGANTSFVHNMSDPTYPLSKIIADPAKKLASLKNKADPRIPVPLALYLPERLNSQGLDLSDEQAFGPVIEAIKADRLDVLSPVITLDQQGLAQKLANAQAAFERWQFIPVETRAERLEQLAGDLQTARIRLYRLLIDEGGKTLEDAVSEVREAIDYCYYYAQQARKNFRPVSLMSPTGEENILSLHPRGVIVCISPWNFPLAIFLGQVTAALAAGNVVLAKPASQTQQIAQEVIKLLQAAGFHEQVVQLVPAQGQSISEQILPDSRVKGVVFTGSTDTARNINQILSHRPGAIIPLIAETGGQNAMIVDSSSLPEQVTQDVITSCFKSAGQRCSALRVLFLQEEVADKIIEMIVGAMALLQIGDPLCISTDVGPLIDEGAQQQLEVHVEALSRTAKLIYRLPLPEDCPKQGAYFGPCLFEIPALSYLTKEVFGPILHVIRFKSTDLEDVIEQINQSDYGLTLGIQSRINETINTIVKAARVGNIYINRNMIGAVVGVQPFGGEGLSGTGPKAGGPHYIARLAVERTVSVNTTAFGGNASLMSLKDD